MLETRKREFVGSYTVGTVTAAGGFAISAIQTCRNRFDNEPPSTWRNFGACLVSGAGFCFSSFTAIYHNTGEEEETDSSKRAVDSPWYKGMLGRHSDFGVLDAVQPLGQLADAEGIA